MTSQIFNVKTSEDELEATNFGVGPTSYEQIEPQSDATGTSFAGAAQRFKWQSDSTEWPNFAGAYMGHRNRLTKADKVTPLTMSDDIAPAMGYMATMYQKAELRLNGKTIEIISDHLAQRQAHIMRHIHSDSWMETTGAKNFWQSDFRTRQAVVCSDSKVNESKVEVLESTTTVASADLGYEEAKNQVELTVNTESVTMDITQNTGAALPIGLYTVGDIITIGVKAYTVLNVLVDTVATTTLDLSGGDILATAVAVQFLTVNTFTRSRVTGTDVASGRNVSVFETQWTLPLSSFYDATTAMPGGGNWELILTPHPKNLYKQRAIESTLSNKVPGVDFELEIIDVYLYMPSIQGPRVEDLTYYIDMETVEVTPREVLAASYGSRKYDVPGTTNKVGVAFQDRRAGEDTRIPSTMFRSFDTGFTQSVEKNLTRMMIKYAGQTKPNPDADPTFEPGTDTTTRLWYERLLSNGQAFESGAQESIEKWHARGSEYFWLWPKDGSNKSTGLQVYAGFSGGATTVDNMNTLVFAHHRHAARVTIKAGSVVSVEVWDR